ncbi:chemotaxis protein CheB [Paracoccus sp. (in: a-proteobacteria)]|uniref:chemotaxis protein CheB n=1 Tax=Paracoccus sp. TaxID=267 RepID=UPI00396C7056
MNEAAPSHAQQRHDFVVMAIGASAGGLKALDELLRDTQRDDRAAYIVIQHRTKLSVQQAVDDTPLQPGQVYTIPPGARMLIWNGRLKLTEFDQPRGLRRPINDFFQSLAHDCGPTAACVILSGRGSDGILGRRAIKEHGGLCVVQEPGTARHDGMPLSAEATGLIDYILPPYRILSAIL